MASTLLPRQPRRPNDASASIFLPTVCLYDWWLIQAEKEFQGKRLGVAGFTSPRDGSVKRAIRVFKSAPITKVYDFSTLETADNVCVIIKGLMNKSLTTDNGFSPEVSKHFVFGFPVNWEKFTEQQNSSAENMTSVDQGILGKEDWKSAGKHKKFEKENQPCARVKNDHCTQAKDYLGPDLPEDGTEEKVEEPSSAPALFKTERDPHHHVDHSITVEKDPTSPSKHKSKECTNQPSVRTRNYCAAESVHNHLGSNHLRDNMEDTREDPSFACAHSSKNSSHDHIDQGSPVKKDQTCTGKQNGVKNANKPNVRTRSYYSAEGGQNHLDSDHPGNDMEETPEEPSSAPVLVKSKRSSHQHNDQGSLCKQRNARNRKGDNARTRSKSSSKSAQNHTSADLPKDGVEESQAEPSSAPPLVKPKRSSHRQTGTAKKGATKRETNTAGVIPNSQGMVRTPDSFKRSRSGRILLPRLAYWLNELPIYDENRSIAGVQGLNKVDDIRDSGNVSTGK